MHLNLDSNNLITRIFVTSFLAIAIGIVLVSSQVWANTEEMATTEETNTLIFVDADGEPLVDVILFQIASADGDEGVSSAATEPTEHIMDQVSRQFSPEVLVVSKGDSVSFPNSDSIRHHVYSFSSARSFDLELYGNSETPTLDFPRSGLVVVGCNIHDEMIGYIVITENEVAFRSDSKGRMPLTAEITNEDAWFAWHPWMAAAGFAPVPLTGIARDEPMQFSIRAPAEREESDLESRFRRRLNRGN